MREIRADMREYYSLPHPQLKSYLDRQVRGNPVVLTTPFGDTVGFENLFDEMYEHLKSTLSGELAPLLEYEETLAKKSGPQSFQKPLAERLGSIESYFTLPTIGEPVSQRAIEAAWQRLGRVRELPLFNMEQVLDQLKKNTNSGSPYFTKRSLVLDKGLLGKVSNSEGVWFTDTPDGRFKLTATLGWRGQPGGPEAEDVKQRVLWMFPMDLNITEDQVYFPLVHYMQRRGFPSWLGNVAVDDACTKLIDTTDPNDWLICTDFSSFDQHYGPTMQEATLGMLDKMFRRTDEYEKWKSDVFHAKYKIPICIAWKRFLIGDHGMASGSGGTNGDETLGHAALQDEAAIEHNTTLNQHSLDLGDDGALSGPGLTAEHVFESYEKRGLEMQLQKFMVDHDCMEYLKRWHSRNYRVDGKCVGVYSTLWALTKMRYIERYHDPKVWGAKAICSRNLAIANNCEYHPEREKFLDICIRGDKYRMGLDIPGYLDDFEKEIKTAINNGVVGFQYTDSYGAKPAKDWWVYKALMARR